MDVVACKATLECLPELHEFNLTVESLSQAKKLTDYAEKLKRARKKEKADAESK